MRRVAFYAPLKSPEHPVPSGDREMARNLMDVIGADGSKVDLISELRSFDPKGDIVVQARLASQAEHEIKRLIATLKPDPIDMWVTYHNYYKSPDLIGPNVCAALGVPYVQIESTRAKRRLHGRWANFATAAEAASDTADIIFFMTEQDRETLERDRTEGQELVHLRPFLPLDALAPSTHHGGQTMLSVGMMRPGDKLASYQIIADTLGQLKTSNWKMNIVGDGPARAEVERLMAPFSEKVSFLGQLDKDEVALAYRNAGLFVWPGVNEAYGMVYLEAQAAGLAVVAQDRPGVRDVLLPGDYPLPEEGAKGLANKIDEYLNAPDLRQSGGMAACKHVERFHLRPAAIHTLSTTLQTIKGRVT